MNIITVNSGAAGTTSVGDGQITFEDAVRLANDSAGADRIEFIRQLATVRMSDVVVEDGELIIDGDSNGDGIADVALKAEGRAGLHILGDAADVTLSVIRVAEGEVEGQAGSGGQNRPDAPNVSWQEFFRPEDATVGFRKHWGASGGPGEAGQDAAPIIAGAGTLRLDRVTFADNRASAGDGGRGGNGGDAGDGGDDDQDIVQPGADGGAGGLGGEGGRGGDAAAGFLVDGSARVVVGDVAFEGRLSAFGGGGGNGGTGGDGGNGGDGGDGRNGNILTGRQPTGGGDGGRAGGGASGGRGGDGGNAAAAYLVAGDGEVEWLGGAAFSAQVSVGGGNAGSAGAGGKAGVPGKGGEGGGIFDPQPDGDDGATASDGSGFFGDPPTDGADLSVALPGGAPSVIFARAHRGDVAEGKALVFAVERLGDASSREVVRWRLGDGASDDVRGDASGKVALKAGETSARVRVKTVEDGLSEGVQTLDFNLRGGRLSEAAALGTRQASGVIRDGDGGGAGRDRLKGSSDDDFINGLGGRDILKGRDGGDFLMGGRGRDRMLGGNGDDFLLAEGGKDRAFGGRGADFITGDRGGDALSGGGGRDRLFGQEGEDVLRGGRGRDLLSGGTGMDDMTGGGGRDEFLLSERDGARDRIRDFQAGRDVMELFDDGEITFLGEAAFDGSAQAVRVVERKRGVVVKADDDGDGRADLAARVWLKGNGTLDADDFGFF